MPENISTFGHQIDNLTGLITYMGLPSLILAEGFLLFFAFYYRKKQGGKATYITGEKGGWKGQVLWVIIPLVAVIIMDEIISFENGKPWDDIKVNRPAKGLQIGITAQQFNWVFHYTGKDAILWNENDAKNPDVMVVPVNTNILFDLQARDVLHSFWVPALRLKQDAIPGRIIKGWFNATKIGEYDIACAEICGPGHGKMAARLKVVSEEDFKKFLADASKKKVTGADLVKMKGCTGCHNIEGPTKVGPTWKGIYDSKREIIREGEEMSVKADEDYLRASILYPNRDKHVDYQAGVMPKIPLTDNELDLIVDYLKTLK